MKAFIYAANLGQILLVAVGEVPDIPKQKKI
jgi:hypothetical protein